jgi:hypothetical protein
MLCAVFSASISLVNTDMRYFEFSTSPKKPLTPPQARIASLKRNAEVTKNALQAEKKAQQIAKAQQRIRQLSSIKSVV